MVTARRRSLADVLDVRARHCVDITDVARAVCDTVGTRIPYDFGCLATTDPSTGLISWAFKSRPLDIGDEEFAAAEYGGGPDVNRFSELATRPDPVGVLSLDTGGRPDTCRRFRDFLAPRFGFTDELRVAFRSRGLTWGALAVYRGADEPAFTADDARELVSVHARVAELIQGALFRPGSVPDAVPGPAVIVVDGQDRVVNLTPSAHARVDELGGWDHGSLPSTVLVTVAAARSTHEPATNRAVGPDGTWLVIGATTFAPPARGGAPPADVVVTVDRATPADVSALALAARGLSRREQEVAGLVLQGVATKGIAQSLHLSPHTVQDHLKSIFTKVGVSSRRELVQQLVLG
jgi:DNA-binding CsgD family transcriptional regulator